jgi:hypothetical protein
MCVCCGEREATVEQAPKRRRMRIRIATCGECRFLIRRWAENQAPIWLRENRRAA